MRLFIAITIPDEIKEKIIKATETFKRVCPDAKWVKAENIHMTLKFLGEVEEKLLEEIQKVITQTAFCSSFTVKLTHFGFFPSEKNPRVFFIATDKEEILKGMADNLEENLEKLGFPKEKRFLPHLTLARFREAKNIEALKSAVHRSAVEGSFTIEAITLYKSTLKKDGPVYENIFRAALTPPKIKQE
ncbi:MAG: RNA 2',3'-cyclic phosphodiesterase [Candidatus Omnitrophica bacterium]|nr:RNA 2',3'-cyclic phosphodiesterase [Candidatus Omnitrophota bacterium]